MEKQNNKRLVLILSIFPQRSETFIVSKFLGLLERGWDVHIVCNHRNKIIWNKFPELVANTEIKRRVHCTWPIQPRWLVPFLLIPALTWSLVIAPQSTWRYLKMGWKSFGWDIFRRFYLDVLLIQLKPDIFHFEFGSLSVGRTYLKELLDAKLSVSFRGYDLNFAALDDPRYYSQLWQTIDGCHVLSAHLWHRAQQRGCPPDMFYSLIPPAIDLSKFPEPKRIVNVELGSTERPLRILSVGRLEWKKGYEHALQAIRQLVDRGIHCDYQIIGTGDYLAALHFARYQLALIDSVRFCGALPHAEVIRKLAWADVFFHPSLSEGFCNAVLEAQAMGVPVICTDAGGLPGNVKDGVTGYVVPRRDTAVKVENLALLAGNVDLRRRIGDSGRKRIETHFQMKQQLTAFENFYKGLLEITQ